LIILYFRFIGNKSENDNRVIGYGYYQYNSEDGNPKKQNQTSKKHCSVYDLESRRNHFYHRRNDFYHSRNHFHYSRNHFYHSQNHFYHRRNHFYYRRNDFYHRRNHFDHRRNHFYYSVFHFYFFPNPKHFSLNCIYFFPIGK